MQGCGRSITHMQGSNERCLNNIGKQPYRYILLFILNFEIGGLIIFAGSTWHIGLPCNFVDCSWICDL